MTNEIETERRFTTLEEQGKQNLVDHLEIKTMVKDMSNKMDTYMSCKADKSEVENINKKLWGFVSAAATAFISIVVYLIQSNMGR